MSTASRLASTAAQERPSPRLAAISSAVITGCTVLPCALAHVAPAASPPVSSPGPYVRLPICVGRAATSKGQSCGPYLSLHTLHRRSIPPRAAAYPTSQPGCASCTYGTRCSGRRNRSIYHPSPPGGQCARLARLARFVPPRWRPPPDSAPPAGGPSFDSRLGSSKVPVLAATPVRTPKSPQLSAQQPPRGRGGATS